MQTNNFKATVRHITTGLGLICFILVFCPSFLISCQSYEIELSTIDATFGKSFQGETITDGNPILFLAILIPIAIAILPIIKRFLPQIKLEDKFISLIVTICGAIDFIIAIAFKSGVKSEVASYGITVKSTFWFYLNIIALIIVMILGALVLLNKMTLDTDLIAFVKSDQTKQALDQMKQTATNVASTVSEKTKETIDNVKESIDEKKNESSKGIKKYCTNCGGELKPDAKFCSKCGAKVDN